MGATSDTLAQTNALTDSFRVLVVPGLHGSGAAHWQSRWQQLHPAYERVEQEHWDNPDLSVWSQRLQQVLAQRSAPTLIVAHSFGCLTTIHSLLTRPDAFTHVAGALLVAPADPVKFEVADLLQSRLSIPALLVGSRDDPWMSATRAAHWAQVWGSQFVDAGALGHINADSGLGDWPAGQRLLHTLAQRAATSNSGLHR